MRAARAGRRETLKRLSGLTLAQALPLCAFADAASLNALGRTALVIGNGAYRGVPELANPVNDARAIAARLADMRFQVVSRIDAAKVDMERAIRDYVAALAKSKGVGLFYFAGHGFQMDWRNYLVPVDAALEKSGDVAKNTIELAVVLDGLRNASNPMNIVILDACRDNPFGADARSGKGLSQVDAPVGTLLAYATSPGNTASDGAGANGLYTENLLREMRAPDAKIEDIFKRVRLNVRRASNGRQIPWESTSLEDDFYFVPPTMLAKSQSETDRRFADERDTWQRAEAKAQAADRDAAKASATEEAIAALEDYLRRHPSGSFSELAQARLDRLLARQGEKRVVPIAPATPFTKGAMLADTDHRVGDWVEVRTTDLMTGIARSGKRIVTAVSALEIVYDGGDMVIDPVGNVIFGEGRRYVDSQHFPAEYMIGKKWRTKYAVNTPAGDDFITLDYAIVAREPVDTALGRITAFRVEGRGWAGRGGRREFLYWAAPDRTRRFLVQEQRWWDGRNAPIRNRRSEVIAFFEQSRAPA